MPILQYSNWQNFKKIIDKGKTSCENSGISVYEHFIDVDKTIKMPKGAVKTILDYELTRYACYLIAQNGDSRKKVIALAQTLDNMGSEEISHTMENVIYLELKKRGYSNGRKKMIFLFDETKKEKETVPFSYVGVTALGVNYMSLLIVADCKQINYDEVKMSLLRELKLLIDKNGIKKPKPTMYFSQEFANK